MSPHPWHRPRRLARRPAPRCVIYARARDEMRRDATVAVARQLRAARKGARLRGWTIAGTFVDINESADDRERPGLAALLERCSRTPPIQKLIVQSLDRLARNMDHAVALLMTLRSRHIRLVPTTVPRPPRLFPVVPDLGSWAVTGKEAR